MSRSDPSRFRILYAGVLGPDQLCLLRCRALEDLGAEVIRFDYEPFMWAFRAPRPVRAVRKLLPRVFLRAINRAFVAAVKDASPDIVYVDKGIYFSSSTIRRAMLTRSRRGVRPLFLHFHPDDAFHPKLYSALYEKTVPLWDCHFLPHRWVLEQHIARGARRVEFWPYGFYAPVHSPVPASEGVHAGPAADVAFVGRWERSRATDLERLAQAGIDVRVWGSLWERLHRASPLRPHVRFRSVIGKELAAVASLSKISLGFLSETNRNGHTSRTFEIPASGGFLLAQRSDGQKEFFEEGTEMECFGSWEEMSEKIRWYLMHEVARERIRAAGLKRCQSSGYSYLDRFRFLLRVAEECREAQNDAKDDAKPA